MTAGNPPLSLLELPAEVLEDIVLQLGAQEILKLRILNRELRDLIDASPAIQYRVDLFSAALEDDPNNTSLVLADRRAHLEQYRSRWDRYNQAKRSSVELPPHTKRVIDGEVLACIQEAAEDKIDITFIRLPSASRGIERKKWVLKGLPKNDADLKIYPALDLLVIPEIHHESAFQIHLLRLSDGQPHPVTPTDQTTFYVETGEGKTITKLTIMVSKHRLMVAVAVHPTSSGDGGIIVWDLQSGDRIFGSPSSFPVAEAQLIDDHRVLGVVKHPQINEVTLLVLWDTSGSQQRRFLFEMPLDKLEVIYMPECLMSSASAQSILGLHRADPDQKTIGVICKGSYGEVSLDDDYMMIISAADLCAHASAQSAGEQKIRWERWRSSITIVRINLAITAVACISGSRFFAVVKGVSHTPYATLLRIYDFSPGARGRRHPNKPPVRDIIVNAASVVKQVGNASWDISEDNLLMFNTHIMTRRVTLHLWTM